MTITKTITKKNLFIAAIVISSLLAVFIIYFTRHSPENFEYQTPYQFVTINSHRIHYIDQGKGMPLIFIHGFGSSLFCWRKNLPVLSEHYRVYALDLLGFGLSDKPSDERYSIGLYTRLVLQFMDALKIEKAVLVGHSLGGGIAILTALKYPDRIKGLILIDTEAYAVSPPFMVRVSQLPVVRSFIHHFIGKWIVHISLKRSFYEQSLITDDLINNYYRPFITENGKKAPIQLLQGMDFNNLKIHSKHYKTIRKKTLIIWGKEDKISPLGLAYRLHKDIKTSTLKIIPRSGHLVQEEKPIEVNEVIINFLRKVR